MSIKKQRSISGFQSINDSQFKNLKKSIYTSYSKLSEVKLITIGLASSERIKQWAEKTLPSGKVLGEITNANTLHHKTFKPQKGGLFCERIFGPLKDFECACGKSFKLKKDKFLNSRGFQNLNPILENSQIEKETLQKNLKQPNNFKSLNKSILGQGNLDELAKANDIPNLTRNFCNNCEVEYTWSVMRRYQLGYIKLISPVTHVWYLKGNPSYLSILLDIKKRHLENIAYCSETLTLENGLKGGVILSKSSDIVSSWKKLKLKINKLSLKTLEKDSNINNYELKTKTNFRNENELIPESNLIDHSTNLEYEFNTQGSETNKGPIMQKLSKEIKTFYDWTTHTQKKFNNVHTDLTILNKIKKRQNLKEHINKYEFWKQFHNNFSSPYMGGPDHAGPLEEKKLCNDFIDRNNITENYKSASKFNLKHINQPLSDQHNSQGLPYNSNSNSLGSDPIYSYFNNSYTVTSQQKLIKVLSKYSKKIKNRLENLKHLSFLIIKAKELKSKNKELFKKKPEPTDHLKKFPIKQILKNVSISSYILLTINIFSQNIINKTISEIIWKKLLQESFIKSIIKVNKLLIKINSSIYTKKFLSLIKNESVLSEKSRRSLTNLSNVNFQQTAHFKTGADDAAASSAATMQPGAFKFNKTNKINEQNIKNSFLQKTFNFATIHLQLTEKNKIKKLKQKVRMNINPYIFSHLNFLINSTNKKKKPGILNSNVGKLENYLNTIELYTLSNFSLSFSNFLISNFLLEKLFDVKILNNNNFKNSKKEIQTTTIKKVLNNFLERIIKHLSSNYFKILLENKSFNNIFWLKVLKLKKLIKDNNQKKIVKGSQIYLNSKQLTAFKTDLKMDLISLNLKNIKNSLFKFYLKGKFKFLDRQVLDSFKKSKHFILKFPKFKQSITKLEKNSFKKLRQLKNNILDTNYNKNISSKDSIENIVVLNFLKLDWIQVLKKKMSNNFILVEKENDDYFNNWSSFELSIKKNVINKDFSNEINKGFQLIGLKEKNVEFNDTNVKKKTINSWPLPIANFKTKKLYNNIYCLSHRERWETENDWNFLYYYVTVQNFTEAGDTYEQAGLSSSKIIQNYRIRFENVSKINFFNSNFSHNFYSSTGMVDIDHASAATPQKFLQTNAWKQISSSVNQSAFENTNKINNNTLFSGPGIIQLLLSEFNFFEIKKIDKQNRILLYQLNKQILKLKKRIFNRTSKKELKEAYKKRDLLVRRTKLVRKLFIKESKPQDMILTILPVLPPDLRPIVKMGNQIAASDLNRLYQRVIYRNDRLKKFLKDPATSNSYEMKYAQRLLQEAVDNLIQNGKSGVATEKDSRGRALKSLSDILKGKQGRFRQYLLGKRVDYSGRSVIVVGPKLKLHECGLPKEMALELYLPFLLKRILNDKLSRTVVGAKMLIKTNPPLIWELLREIMQTCPVLLNRAPTLHRLGIQAFQPKLIDGKAILLHPLVCSAFNADFDGDQMAVHVPITVEARAEAWKLMLSRNSILAPATGDPLAIPSQDMVLGCYYLTTSLLNSSNKKMNTESLENEIQIIPTEKNRLLQGLTKNFEQSENNKLAAPWSAPSVLLNLTMQFDEQILLKNSSSNGFYFSKINEVLKAYELKKIKLHDNIWLKCNPQILIDNSSEQEEPIEIRLELYGNWKEIYYKSQKRYNSKNVCLINYILTTPGKIIFNLAIQRSLN